MSIFIRHLTNGKKTGYIVHNEMDETTIWYDKIEDVPESIRHYAEKKDIAFVGPESAFLLGAKEALYPDFNVVCSHPHYGGERCIAEMCRFAPHQDYTRCQFYRDGLK